MVARVYALNNRSRRREMTCPGWDPAWFIKRLACLHRLQTPANASTVTCINNLLAPFVDHNIRHIHTRSYRLRRYLVPVSTYLIRHMIPG